MDRLPPAGIAILLVMASLYAGAVHAAAGSEVPSPAAVPGEVILRLRPGPARAASAMADAEGRILSGRLGLAKVDVLGKRLGVRAVRAVRIPPLHGTGSSVRDFFAVELGPEQSRLKAIEAYRALPEVLAAQLNYVYEPDLIPNDPLYPFQFAHPTTSAPQGWDVTTGQSAVVIAFIGTGIELAHPDLAANIVSGWDFIDGDADPDAEAGEFHETMVAGIAAAVGNNGIGVAGVCWGCGIMPLRAAYTSEQVAQAVDFAVANGADIVNMSFGNYDVGKYGPDTIVNTAVTNGYQSGVVMVATAGNDHVQAKRYPGALDEVVAVAMTYTNDDSRVTWSNYGSWVAMAAPGVAPRTTYPGGTYLNGQGTSVAAPYVAGTAGLMLSRTPGMPPETVRRILEYSSDPVDPTSFAYRFIGSGRVNVASAVTLDDVPSPASVLKSPLHRDLTPALPWDIEGTSLGDSYILDRRAEGAASWATIATGGSIVDGVLGTVDPATLPSGNLEIRLRSYDGPISTTDQITVFQAEPPPYQTGWPVTVGLSILGAPTVVDLDGDGLQDVIVRNRDSSVHAWRHDGTYLPGWPTPITGIDWGNAPAVGDVDGDGEPEVVVAFRFLGWVDAWNADGTPLPGFTRIIPGSAGSHCTTLANLDADPELEIVVVASNGLMDVFDGDGTSLPGWPVTVGTNIQSCVAVGDIDQDGAPEIVIRPWTQLHALEADGTPVAGAWPAAAFQAHYPPAIGDLDGNGSVEVVAVESGAYASVWNGSGAAQWGGRFFGHTDQGAMALADLDGNGLPEILFGDDVGTVNAIVPMATWLAGWPATTLGVIDGAPAIFDTDADGTMEIFAVSGDGRVHGWAPDGTTTFGTIPDTFEGGPVTSPAVGDLDGDGDPELVVVVQDTVHVLDLPGTFVPDAVEWGMLQHDARHTGHLRFQDPDLQPQNLAGNRSLANPAVVDLTWDAAVGGPTGYLVYRDGQYLARVGRVLAFQDGASPIDVPSDYHVVGIDAGAILSPPSAAVTVEAPDTEAPLAPSGLEVAHGPKIAGKYSINLGWNPAVDNVGVTSYRGYRDGLLLFEQAAPQTTYVDPPLAGNRTYIYRVEALDEAGNVSLSSSDAAITPPNGPQDCDDADPAVWSTPGEVPGVAFVDPGTLGWQEPVPRGAAQIVYDLLRSSSPADFVATAICLESDDTDRTAATAAVPSMGAAYFYLLRAENGCPAGTGTLGADSSEAPRIGRTCP